MTDESITIPDFLPLELEDEHLTHAREQVQQSRQSHRQRAKARPRASDDAAPVVGGHARGGPVSWLSSAEIPLVAAATVIGLLGLSALTTWWSWLAVTHDPMWWGFTAVGGLLLGLLAWVTVTVQLHRRRLVSRDQADDELLVRL